MKIRDDAVSYLTEATKYMGENRWMKDDYTKAYHGFVRKNGMCSTKEFDVAVIQAKRVKAGNHNYKAMGRHGNFELTHTTMMRPTQEKSAFQDALKRRGFNV